MDLGNLGTLLGVAIGFTTVMFVLSMVVTAVVQWLSSVLRIRAYVAQWVTGEVLSDTIPLATARTVAKEVLAVRTRTRRILWLVTTLAGPRKDAYTQEELTTVVERHAGANAAATISKELYEQLRAGMREVYTTCMRVLSTLAGFALACAFQISATDLLRDLSIDSAMRERLVDLGVELANDPQVQAAAADGFAERNIRALDILAAKYPNARRALEEMSGATVDAEDALAELREVVEGRPDAKELTDAYAKLLQEEQKSAQDREAAMALVLDRASILDLRFWPRDDYYRKDGRWLLENIFGVFITGILLTLGAPFWYEKLRDLNVLRESLYGKKPAEPTPAWTATTAASVPPPPPETGAGGGTPP